MLPKTMPGFLLLAGVIMFVFSLFSGKIRAKDLELPALSKLSRWALGCVGAVFILLSFWFYLHSGTKNLGLQPLRPVSKDPTSTGSPTP